MKLLYNLRLRAEYLRIAMETISICTGAIPSNISATLHFSKLNICDGVTQFVPPIQCQMIRFQSCFVYGCVESMRNVKRTNIPTYNEIGLVITNNTTFCRQQNKTKRQQYTTHTTPAQTFTRNSNHGIDLA